MLAFISQISPQDVIPILTIGGGLIVALISVIAGVLLRVHKTNVSARLKQDMLDRGMSAEEIKTVLEAGGKC
jgi:hypothetical protein